MVQTWPNHGPYMVQTWSKHGQNMLQTWSPKIKSSQAWALSINFSSLSTCLLITENSLQHKIDQKHCFSSIFDFSLVLFGFGFGLCPNCRCPGQDGSNNTSNSSNGLKTPKKSRGKTKLHIYTHKSFIDIDICFLHPLYFHFPLKVSVDTVQS